MKYSKTKFRKKAMNLGLLIMLSGFLMVTCDTVSNNNPVEPNQDGLTLQFQAVTSSAGNITAADQAGDSVVVKGDNGALIINDIRFIVDDFEIELTGKECTNKEKESDHGCEEFEFDLFFVDLPLNGDTLKLDSSPVPLGLYTELEFEVDNLELESEGDEEKKELLQKIRKTFPNWPDSVSMVVAGRFISAQNDTTEYQTFAEAEVEVEMEFEPPLEVNKKNVNKLITIKVNPEKWFLRGDGTVINLAKYDFSSTGKVFEFEAEIENGFVEIETEDDSKDD